MDRYMDEECGFDPYHGPVPYDPLEEHRTRLAQQHFDAPRTIDHCSIRDGGNNSEFRLDDSSWRIGTASNDGIGIVEFLDPSLPKAKVMKYQNKRTEEVLAEIVRKCLLSPGISIKIKKLSIKNHPYGFESLPSISVDEFEWICDIVSDRYDYTTWFHSIRGSQLRVANIEINGSHDGLLGEQEFLTAESLTVETQKNLPIPVVQKFSGKSLKMTTRLLTSKFLEAICEKAKWGWGNQDTEIELTARGAKAGAVLRDFLVIYRNIPDLGAMTETQWTNTHKFGKTTIRFKILDIVTERIQNAPDPEPLEV